MVRAFCLGNRACAHIEQGQLDEALKEAKLANDTFPNNPGMVATLGRALYSNGLYDDSLDVLNRAVDMNPRRGETYWYRHELYKLLKNDAKADLDEKTARAYGYRPGSEFCGH